MVDLGRFWEGLGKIWGGFGEGLGKVWGGFGKVLGMKFSSHWRNEGRPADRALRLNPPPHRGRACWTLNQVVLLSSLHLKCLPRIFFPESCPSKLLNPSLFLSPAPRTFRRPGPRWVETSWFGIFFSNCCFQNTFQILSLKKHRKKLENKGFWPPKTVPKPFENPSQIDVPEQA